MLHEHLPTHLREEMEQREAAVNTLASAALFLTSVEAMWQAGDRSTEIQQQMNEAGAAYNLAISGLLAANQRIREAEWER